MSSGSAAFTTAGSAKAPITTSTTTAGRIQPSTRVHPRRVEAPRDQAAHAAHQQQA